MKHQPHQLELLSICDCCGGIYDGRPHKACNAAWAIWLRDDNFEQWADATWPSDAARAAR